MIRTKLYAYKFTECFIKTNFLIAFCIVKILNTDS